MEDKQKPLRNAASKVKDIYNTYVRNDEKPETPAVEEVVRATTSQDINQVHVHHENTASGLSEASNHQTDSVSPDIESISAQLAKAEKERDDLRDQVLRKIAEFENYKKRTDREKEQLSLYVTEKLFTRLVEVLDDLQAALDAGRKSQDYTSMVHGLEMIYNKAHRIYEEHGVRPLNVEQNTVFNVDEHEALMHIQHSDIPEGQVIQQIQRGYVLGDKVLRHAKVVTSAGAAD